MGEVFADRLSSLNPEVALEPLETLANSPRASTSVYQALAMTYLNLGREQDAARALSSSLSLNPSNGAALVQLALYPTALVVMGILHISNVN